MPGMCAAGEPQLTNVCPHSHCHTVPAGYSLGVGGMPMRVPFGSGGGNPGTLGPSPLLVSYRQPGEHACSRFG